MKNSTLNLLQLPGRLAGSLKRIALTAILLFSLVFSSQAQPQALFGASGSFQVGDTITFTDLSTTTAACGPIVKWVWYFGDGSMFASGQNQTHIYAAAGQYTVTLAVFTNDSLNDCQNWRDSVIYITDTTSASGLSVWPGDVDGDNMVKSDDVLQLSLAYGSTGDPRQNATTNWEEQTAPQDWNNSFASGRNHKYADCDGDGDVDMQDAGVISMNYNDTTLINQQSASVSGAPALALSLPDSLEEGKTYTLEINLGTASNQIQNIYGVQLAFTFDTDVIDSTSFALDVSNSWLGGSSSGTLITLVKPDYANGIVDIAISRTNQQSVSGYGLIGELSIVIKDDVAGKNLVSRDIEFGFKKYTAVQDDESEMSLETVDLETTVVYDDESGIQPPADAHNYLSIYPNPSGGQFFISTGNESIRSVSVINTLGQTVWSNASTRTGTVSVDLSGLEKGLYFVQVVTTAGPVVRAIELQ